MYYNIVLINPDDSKRIIQHPVTEYTQEAVNEALRHADRVKAFNPALVLLGVYAATTPLCEWCGSPLPDGLRFCDRSCQVRQQNRNRARKANP